MIAGNCNDSCKTCRDRASARAVIRMLPSNRALVLISTWPIVSDGVDAPSDGILCQGRA